MKPTANRLLLLLTAGCLLPLPTAYCQLPTENRPLKTAMRFAVVTDTHLNRNNPQPEEDLRRTVEDINADTTIQFVLATGDLTESGDRKSLQKAKNLLDQLHVKYYAVPGNHETKWSESGATDFGHIFGAERFDFEHGGIRFFGFNTGPIIRMMDGHISPADIEWLRQELATLPKEQPVVLVTHYPLRDEDVDNWCDLTNVVRRYNIKAFIGGHYHSNRLYSYDGIPAFICRSNLRDAEDSTGGYSVFDVAADSITVYERKPGRELRRWGAYSLSKKYYSPRPVACTGYDLSVNTQYPQVREVWRVENGEWAGASVETWHATSLPLSTLHSPFSIRSPFYASPAVYNNKVYVGDDNGVFSCYSLSDGSLQWQYAVGSRQSAVGSQQSAVGSGSRH